jgi:hypothetical protein
LRRDRNRRAGAWEQKKARASGSRRRKRAIRTDKIHTRDGSTNNVDRLLATGTGTQPGQYKITQSGLRIARITATRNHRPRRWFSTAAKKNMPAIQKPATRTASNKSKSGMGMNPYAKWKKLRMKSAPPKS